MKKSLILLAAAALVLVGCKKEEEVQKYDSISINPQEITWSVDKTDGTALSLNYTPTSAQAPKDVQWTSSDESIVTVSNKGWITPVAVGEATVTAKVGDLTATCKVNIVEFYDVFALGDFGLFDVDDKALPNSTYSGTLRSGESFTADLHYGTWYVWDDGITYVDGSGLTGTGYMTVLIAPVYIITKCDNDNAVGAYLSSYLQIIPDKKDGSTNYGDSAYCSIAGDFVDFNAYAEFIDRAYLQKDETLTEADEEAFLASTQGAEVFYADWTGETPRIAPTSAFIKEGIIGDPENYYLAIEWFTGFLGLQINEAGDDVVRPYKYSTPVIKTYQVGLEEIFGDGSAVQEHKAMPAKALKPCTLKKAQNMPTRALYRNK